jgi:hypothetical protein
VAIDTACSYNVALCTQLICAPVQDRSNTSDPYVKCKLVYNGLRTLTNFVHAKKCMSDKTRIVAFNEERHKRLDKIDDIEKRFTLEQMTTREKEAGERRESEESPFWVELETALDELVRPQQVRSLMDRAKEQLHNKQPKDECQKAVTATRKKELNPYWDETLQLFLPPWDSSTEGRESLFDYFEFASCSLTMRCLDWNRGGKRRHENIGDVWWENGELWSPGLLVQDIVDDSEKYLDVV